MEEHERRGTQILNFTARAALTKNGGARGQERDSSGEGERGGGEGKEGRGSGFMPTWLFTVLT